MPDPQSPDDAQDLPWDDLVISILSVNQYSLERTYDLLQGLQRQKITDPLSLALWEPQEIESKLKAGGCDRGAFTTKLFAERLSALGRFVRTKGIDECDKIVGSRDARAIENLLMPIKGIGPVVLRNFFSLRGIRTP